MNSITKYLLLFRYGWIKSGPDVHNTNEKARDQSRDRPIELVDRKRRNIHKNERIKESQ
jgi:hypothetical protein